MKQKDRGKEMNAPRNGLMRGQGGGGAASTNEGKDREGERRGGQS